MQDLTGGIFGRFTVLRRVYPDTKSHNSRWLCKCKCGIEREVVGSKLLSGWSRSCGCLRKDMITKHGHNRKRKRSITYNSWHSMMQRCTNPNNPNFKKRYGAHGIKVCKRWLKFKNFLDDMGERPTLRHSLHRIANDGNYDPGNCTWGTESEQANNKSSTVFITFKGKKLSLMQWSKMTGISYEALQHRRRAGWSSEKMLTTPVQKRKVSST